MYKIWRQSYIGTDGNIKPAAIIARSENSIGDAFRKLPGVRKQGNDLYWMYLKLYMNEEDANKEIFDINSYE